MALVALIGTDVALCPLPAMAQDATATNATSIKKRPELQGHRFIPNPLTQEAFPRTSVEINMGVGQALDVELLPLTVLSNGDTLQGLHGDLAVALLGVEYGYAIREWLQISAAFGMVARLGTDVGSLFSEGATILTNVDVGWLFRVLERQSFYLSGDVVVQTSGFTGLQVGSWIDGLIDSTQVPLVSSLPSLRTTVGLRMAWALNDLWGVSGSTHMGYGESVSKRESNATTYDLALAVDADLYARTSVPVGFSLSGEFTNVALDGRPDVDDVIVGNLRTAYTGRDDFLIAVDLTFSRLRRRQQLDTSGLPNSEKAVKSGAVMASMMYYF
jgi:hypothetical protein